MGKRIKRQTIEHIPQDIIEDILVNLPVKSLLRFKCVSKQWHSLISSKHFTKYYLKKSTDLIRHNLIYSSYDYTQPYRTLSSLSLRSCSLKSFLDEDDSMVTTTYHDSFMPNSGCLEDIVGSCNGLVLISSRISKHWYNLILWNPSTRQVKIIPPPRYYARRKSYNSWHRFVYGFGYDDSTDDYKVVIIFVSMSGPYRTQMYSLRTNSWKKIGDFEKGYLRDYSGTHVKGKLHWLVEEGGFGGNKIIVSLSLVDGKYDIVALPPLQLQFSEDDLHCYYTLHDLGGYLSLMKNGSFFFEVWVMMEYGEVESWTNLSDLRDRMRTSYFLTSRPIWLKKNGDTVVTISKSESDSEIDVYDGFGYRVYVVDAGIIQHYIYVESLVSPFGDKKHGP